MPISQVFITEKVRLLSEYLEKAKSIFKAFDDGQILASDNVYVLERMFQLAVEVVIDINNYLIKEADIKPAEDLQSTFMLLAKEGILPELFAEKMAPTVGLRNKIVHVYEKVDRATFVSDFRKDVGDFDQYIVYVLSYGKKTAKE